MQFRLIKVFFDLFHNVWIIGFLQSFDYFIPRYVTNLKIKVVQISLAIIDITLLLSLLIISTGGAIATKHQTKRNTIEIHLLLLDSYCHCPKRTIPGPIAYFALQVLNSPSVLVKSSSTSSSLSSSTLRNRSHS